MINQLKLETGIKIQVVNLSIDALAPHDTSMRKKFDQKRMMALGGDSLNPSMIVLMA